MNCGISKQQYYYLLQLVIVLILSSIAGEPIDHHSPLRQKMSIVAHAQHNEQQRQGQNLISSGLLANGYVPIIISKSTVTNGIPISDSSSRLDQHVADDSDREEEIPPANVVVSTNPLKNVSDSLVPLLDRNVAAILTSFNVTRSSGGGGVIVVNQTAPKLNFGGGVATPSTASSSTLQSAGVFNVLDVVNNLDIRLKHIRNIELGVTYVQEIFDTLGFTADGASKKDEIEITINQLAARIRYKLEVVHDILNNLSDFIGLNVTLSPFVQQQHDEETTTTRRTNETIKPNVFLNTLIQPCPFDDFSLEQNYNKKQIQILNYLKISGFHQLNDLNFTINSQIVNVLRKAILSNDTLATQTHSNVSDETQTSRISTQSTPLSSADKPTQPQQQQQHSGATSNFKHVFFLSRNDHASDHNCQYYFNDMNFRHLYTDAIQSKHVFLVIDHGNAMSREQLELSKQFASNIIQMLSHHDTISIVLVNNSTQSIQLSVGEDAPSNTNQSTEHDWRSTFRYNATMDNKDELIRRLSILTPSKTTTNHSLAFNYSFELLRKQNIGSDIPLTFVYVTRGLLSQFTEPETVLKTIAKGQALLPEPIMIHTCAVILDEKRIMYEKQFLQDIAQQNYSRYNINISSWYRSDRHSIRGNMYVITKRHPELIVKTSTSVFSASFKPKFVSNSIKYHLPVLDYNTKEVIVSITKPIPLYGVAGINMYLNDLAEDIIYYRKTAESYAFLTDTSGWVLYHPAYSRPVATVKTLYPVDIGVLEPTMNQRPQASSVQSLREVYVKQPKGSVNMVQIRTDYGQHGLKNIRYSWHRILNAYIVCIVSIVRQLDDASQEFSSQWKAQQHLGGVPSSGTSHRFERYQMYNVDPVPSSELLYHRIDLIPPPKTPVCRHFRQIATLDTGTIFLSASAFKSPFVYFKNNRGQMNDQTRRTHNAQSIMAYIKDITNLLANPGLQPQIRRDVSALFHVMAYLKKRHLENGALKKYIIRRYVATMNGVLQVYPGCILGADMEPSRRPWFRKAVRHPGRIVTTEPYLDAGGAGYIVTISHTIFEGKANALHNVDKDTPLAVVALDLPFAFFYRMLLESTPLCSESYIKCLLMEDRGYLLAHPSIMEPSTPTMNTRRPLEHITHKESFVANDILNHKMLVRKKACATFQNRIVQRYYEFNTSLVKVLTNNVIHGDRTKYQITAIPGTNLFAVILNSTCDGGAFCPCSTVDRICLNCNRMDQADCECPCECPLRMSRGARMASASASASASLQNTTLDYCEPEVEGLAIVNSLSYDWNLVVKPCVNINCELYTTHAECLGVMGCEWCQLDVDMNPFPTPFCTAQNSCFNGMLGAPTPYGDGDLGSAIIEPSATPAYSAMGPVGGTIIALCLMVGFAMYCYRQNLDNGSEHLYGVDSIHDDNYGVPMSRLYFDDISPHDDSDLSGGGGVNGMMHRNLLQPLTNVIAINEISPYHMSTGGYRRPVNGESDHGYSTMTPHEDSEHMCFNLIEPLINNQKRFSMSADSMSINTSVSSPTNRQPAAAAATPYHQIQESTDRLLAAGDANTTTSLPLKSGASPTRLIGLKDLEPKLTKVPTAMQQLPMMVPGQTIIPDNNSTFEHISSHHILAPVTVHRHMEAS